MLVLKALGKAVDGFLGEVHGLIHVYIKKRQEGFRQAGQVPSQDGRLIAKGITALPIDAGKDRRGRIGLHEGAGAIVNGFARDGGVIRIHHAVDKAQAHPVGDGADLRIHHLGEKFLVVRARVVARNGVVGQLPGVIRLRG